MNDQDLPESDASAMEVKPATDSTLEARHMNAGEEPTVSTNLGVEEVDDFEDEELTDEEFDDHSETDDEDEFAIDAAKSLMEELFDEDDFVEEMSELDVLTLEDAANYLKVEYGAIRRLLKEQGLPGRKIGDEWRFLRGAIADWLRAPGGNAATVAAPERPAQAERSEQRPERQDRREYAARPPVQDRSNQGGEGSRYQRPGSRYPQQGEGNRYPQQEGQPPRRSRYQSEEQQGGGNQGGGYQRQGNQQGGYQGSGQAGGQGSYPPPRRPRYGNDQNQQQPQGEYRPPRRPPFVGGPGGNFENQSGGNSSGSGSYGGTRFNKKPKRKALNEQRFKRLDRRKGADGSGEGESDFDGDES